MKLVQGRLLLLAVMLMGLFNSEKSFAQGPEYYYFCYYGGGVEPMYISEIFANDFHDTLRMEKVKEEFKKLVDSNFALHPNFEKHSYYPRCTGIDEKGKTRIYFDKFLANVYSPGKELYLTKWVPGKMTVERTLYSASD